MSCSTPPVWQHLIVGAAAFAPLLLCAIVALIWTQRRAHKLAPLPRTRAQYAVAASRRAVNDRRVRQRIGLIR